MFSTKAAGILLGIPVTSNADIMTVNGFAMRIITQCTALHYVIILSTAILLYPRHSIRYRALGLVASIIIVIVANAFRLIITGIAGNISRDALIIVHDYLWVGAFSLLILGLWIVWAEQRFTVTLATVKSVFIALITCTAVYGILLLAMPLYGNFIAMSASIVFKAFINDPTADILFTGQKMLYHYSGGELSAIFTPDLMVVALYSGLVLSAGHNRRETVKRDTLGLATILCAIVTVIAGGGAIAVLSGKIIATVFLWTAHGMLLQITLLWWIMLRSHDLEVLNN